LSAIVGRVTALIVLAAVAGACGVGAGSAAPASFPSEYFGPSRPPTGAVAATRAALQQALGARQLQVTDPQVPFRPPESPRLAAAPRSVVQVVLPQDPAHGFVSIYEFADDAAAADAGREQAAYVASGPGRVQFTTDTQFVVRQLGPTIVFFAWSPDTSPDPATPKIPEALETVGVGIPVPS
jgi:hypothetical protein